MTNKTHLLLSKKNPIEYLHTNDVIKRHPAREFIGIRSTMMQKIDPKHISYNDVIKLLTKFYGVTEQQIQEKRRHRNVIIVRHIGIWMLKTYSTLNLRQVGILFGGFNHCSIIHICKKINGYIDVGDPIGKEAVMLANKLR